MKLAMLCSDRGALIPLATSCRSTRATKCSVFYSKKRWKPEKKPRRAILGGRKGVRMVDQVMYWRSVTAGCVLSKTHSVSFHTKSGLAVSSEL